MMFTKEEARFWGLANKLAGELYSATFDEDESDGLLHSLYQEFAASGAKPDEWLRERLPDLFISLNDRPDWVGGEPKWPFHSGRPMIFISQIRVASSQVADTCLSSNTRLFIFGARVTEDDGWAMTYLVVEQLEEFD